MATNINTETQDAITCVLCGNDTSKSQGYCAKCAKKMSKGKK